MRSFHTYNIVANLFLYCNCIYSKFEFECICILTSFCITKRTEIEKLNLSIMINKNMISVYAFSREAYHLSKVVMSKYHLRSSLWKHKGVEKYLKH